MEYAELHAHTNFSFLDGASDPEAMAETAAALGLRGLAITDHDSLSGIVRFGAAAQSHGVHPITGIELSVEPPLARSLTVTRISPHDQPAPRLALLDGDAPTPEVAPLVLLAEDLTGYRNLCALLTEAYRHGGLDAPRVPWEVLARHAGGLVALSGCEAGEVPRALAQGGPEAALAIAARYRDTLDRKSTRLNSSHVKRSRMPSSA